MEQAVFLTIGALAGALATSLVLRSRTDAAVAAARSEEAARHNSALLTESNARTAAETALALEKNAQARLKDAFQALASEALKSNNETFMDLAKQTLATHQETAKGDLTLRQEAIEHLVAPVKQSLQDVQRAIGEMEKLRTGAYAGLREQIKSLHEAQVHWREQADGLRRALSAPQRSGRWGELQLRKVVELSGMSRHCDFTEQNTVVSEVDSAKRIQRPDLVVNLPDGKNLVVDAKAVVDRYLEAVEAPDEVTRLQKLDEHARLLADRVADLSAKEYWQQFEHAPDFVVLFLPGENFFAAALERRPNLFEDAFRRGVLVATPVTLIALLKAAAYGWRQEALARNAATIRDLATDMYRNVGSLAEHFAALGKSLAGAVKKYNEALGSLEHKFLPNARKFPALGVESGTKSMEPLDPIELSTRDLRARELDTDGGSAEP